MPSPITLSNVQSVEIPVSGPNGANRLFITNGLAQINLTATSSSSGGTTERDTFATLIDPELEHFHRAIATGGLGHARFRQPNASQPFDLSVRIRSIEADWDDENRKVQLRIEVEAYAHYPSAYTSVQTIPFQVITLAQVEE